MSDVPETLPDTVREALQGLLDAIRSNIIETKSWGAAQPIRVCWEIDSDGFDAIDRARRALGETDG